MDMIGGFGEFFDLIGLNLFLIIIFSLIDIYVLVFIVLYNWLKKNLINMKNSRVIVCLMCFSWIRR